MEDAYEPARAFYAIADRELVPAVRQGDFTSAVSILGKLTSVYTEHRTAIDKAVALANDLNSATENTAGDQITAGITVLLSIAVFTLLPVISLGLLITGQIVRPERDIKLFNCRTPNRSGAVRR